MLLQLILDDLLGDGDLNQFQRAVRTLSRAWAPSTATLASATCFLMSSFSSSDGVELRKPAVRTRRQPLGQLALLDGGQLDLDDGFLAGVLAAGELGLESCVPRQRTGRSGPRRCPPEHGAGTDLVGQVVSCVHLLAVDLCGDVDGREVLVGGGALDGLQGAEALAQSVSA